VSFQLLAAPQPQPGPVDLDRVEAEAGQFVADGWVARTVPGLAAELRAAREVVEAARAVAKAVVSLRLNEALAAYDRAVSEP
jgi:hypothetical protein